MIGCPSNSLTTQIHEHEADDNGDAPALLTPSEPPPSLSNLNLMDLRAQYPGTVTMNWIAPHLTASERRKYYAKYRKLYAHYTTQHDLLRKENKETIQAAKATLDWIAKCKAHADSDAVKIAPTYLEAQVQALQDPAPRDLQRALAALENERTVFVSTELARRERVATLCTPSLFERTHRNIREVEEQAVDRLVKNFIARELCLKSLMAVEDVMRELGKEV